MMTVRDAWRVVESTTTRGISIDTTGAGDLRCYAYSELVARSAQAAAALRKRGVGRRDLVLISAVTSPAFIVTWIALMRMGAVPVPVPPKETLAGQGAFRQRMEPLLRHHRFYVCRGADAEDLPPSPPGEIVIVRLEEIEAEIGAARAPDAERPFEWPELDLDDEAFVQYTSGSTGHPKGTVITYRNLFANLRAIAVGLELQPLRDTFASWLPLYHDMGLVGKLLSAMFHTASLVLVPPQAFVKDPLGFLKLLDRCRAQVCSMPNFAIEWILRAMAAGRPAEVRLDAVKWLGVGSEPIHAGTLRRFQAEMAGRGLRPTALSPCYGMAEATLAVSMSRPSAALRVTHHEGAEVPCVGSVLPGFEVRIARMEGEGEGMAGAGRILIRGESVSRHARVGAERVARAGEGGFHDTGDIGLFAGDELVVLGRADEMFIVNGANHFPYDIEDVVRGMPELECRRAACFGLPGPEPGARPRVVVVFEGKGGGGSDGRERAEEAIRREILSRFGLRVDEVLAVKRRIIPVTTSGKIQRRRAMELHATGYFHDNQA